MSNMYTLAELLEELYQEYKIFYEGSISDFKLNNLPDISDNIPQYYIRHRNMGHLKHILINRIINIVPEDRLIDLVSQLKGHKDND